MSKKRVAIVLADDRELEQEVNQTADEIEAGGGKILSINVVFHDSGNKAVMIYDEEPPQWTERRRS